MEFIMIEYITGYSLREEQTEDSMQGLAGKMKKIT
jgi:hypothetical protein